MTIFHKTQSRAAEESSPKSRRASSVQDLRRRQSEDLGVHHDRVDYWLAIILILTPWLILLLLLR